MRSKTKRLIGLLLSLVMIIGICAVGIASADAAVGSLSVQAQSAEISQAVRSAADTIATANSGNNMVMVFIIVAIVILVIVIAVVVLIIILNGKKKNTPAAPPQNRTVPQNQPVAPSAPVRSQFNAPQPYTPAPAQRPVQPPVQSPVQVPDDAGETMILNDGSGETTILNSVPPAPPKPVCFTIVRKKNGENILVDKPEFLIGKEKRRVDYCVTDNNSVSRAHAKIRTRAGRAYISDLGSTNCTYVNGVKLSPNQEVILSKGDRIKISDEEFDFLG